VQRFVLFSSKPSTGGGPYVVEEAYPLHESRGGEAAATAMW
jgi:2'-5' RNA ligase